MVLIIITKQDDRITPAAWIDIIQLLHAIYPNVDYETIDAIIKELEANKQVLTFAIPLHAFETMVFRSVDAVLHKHKLPSLVDICLDHSH